jgi:hypothetical protein
MKAEVPSEKAYEELQRILCLEQDLAFIEEKAKFILKKKKEEILKVLEELK